MGTESQNDVSGYLQQQMLIAMPAMADPNFTRSVTLLCQHNEEGAIGITINRVSTFTLEELLFQLKIPCEHKEITSLKVLDLLETSGELRQRLKENSGFFHQGMEALGFTLVPGEHPIIPVMFGEAQRAQDMAAGLLEEGIYVIAFSFPVVPKGQARIRTQMSAAHSRADLERALEAFAKVGRELGAIC